MAPVLEQALPTFVEFADRHGYDLVSRSTSEDSRGRPPSWGKVRLIRQLLDSYDVVLWIDADAIILDSSVDPAGLLGPDDYQGLVLLHQLGQEFPTCGVWLVRSTAKAKSFLEAVWENDTFIDDRYWEQAAALDLLGYSVHPAHLIEPTGWMDGTFFLDEEWNCMPLITRSLLPCRIRHYAGERDTVRRRQMKTDRHCLAVRTTDGWQRRWHAWAWAAGVLRWRLWYGPTGTFGRLHKLQYRASIVAYDLAAAVGLVTLVRWKRRRRPRPGPAG